MTPIQIVLVDDHTILRDGIASILDAEADFTVVGKAGTVAEALTVVARHRPDLVLMDYSLLDGNGLEATREILAAYPGTRIVLLTIHEEDDLLFDAIRSGARGYLLKNVAAGEMLAQLRAVASGEAAISPDQTNRILAEFARAAPPPPPDAGPPPLTDRELEVLRLLVLDASNREIGAELHISIYTVKNHVRNILAKLEVDNRHEAAKAAVRLRLVRSAPG